VLALRLYPLDGKKDKMQMVERFTLIISTVGHNGKGPQSMFTIFILNKNVYLYKRTYKLNQRTCASHETAQQRILELAQEFQRRVHINSDKNDDEGHITASAASVQVIIN